MNFKTIVFSILVGIVFLPVVACQPDGGSSSEEGIETFNIESELKDCVGVGPMKCMVVNGNYFYDKIQGFEFESGYTYELKVKKGLAFGTDDPTKIPADANMYSYELIELVSKESVIPEGCKTWFDGCNNCIVGEDGLLGCTRKFCPPEMMEEAKCMVYEE